MSLTKNHYSYRIYADPEVARNFDSERFGGTIGELIKATQERIVFSVLPPQIKDWKIIDLGAGTGRFTIPFLQAGAEVTACDASAPMLEVLKEKTKDPKLHVFLTDAHQLQFEDQAFDCAVSFRLLLHVINWKQALQELCRVSKDWVVFDFPPRHGFLLLAPLWHFIRKTFSQNVQSYRIFSIREVEAELDKNGFQIVCLDRGFFLPLIIHRAIGNARFTRSAERLFSSTGLTRLMGSPFTVFARRKK